MVVTYQCIFIGIHVVFLYKIRIYLKKNDNSCIWHALFCPIRYNILSIKKLIKQKSFQFKNT
jgi:hypothetical protein